MSPSSPNSYFGSHNRENYYFCTILLVLHRTLSGRISVIFPARMAGINPHYSCIPQIVPLARLPLHIPQILGIPSVLLAWIPKTPPHRGLLLYHESFLRVSILLESGWSVYYSLVPYQAAQYMNTLQCLNALSRGHLGGPIKGYSCILP